MKLLQTTTFHIGSDLVGRLLYGYKSGDLTKPVLSGWSPSIQNILHSSLDLMGGMTEDDKPVLLFQTMQCEKDFASDRESHRICMQGGCDVIVAYYYTPMGFGLAPVEKISMDDGHCAGKAAIQLYFSGTLESSVERGLGLHKPWVIVACKPDVTAYVARLRAVSCFGRPRLQ